MRTERIWLQPSYNLMQYCHKSKNLFNYANYIFKQQLNYRYFTPAFELMDIIRHHPVYTSLPRHTSQQIIKFLVKSWRGYFMSLKSYKNNSGNRFNGLPKPPRYKRKAGFHILYFTANQVKIRRGYILFPKLMGLKIRTRLKVAVKQARIIPRGNSFLLEIVYNRKTKALRRIKNIISVDFGLNNIITAVSNVSKPVIIKGTLLKSINQWFNKENARLTSIYRLQNSKIKYLPRGKSKDYLLDKRYKRFEDLLYKISRKFVNYSINNNIDAVVVGYNDGWKQNIKMGRRNNQNFVNISFLNLLHKIEYKSEDSGIRVIKNEESYTSKCSFLDNEEITKHSSYLGKRLKRGIFQSSRGIEINADCNGAGNIGRKVFPVDFTYGIVDVVSHPVCLSV
ncbi:MAG: IS200/IS605 family element transposase accessory protein TnpB [Candidatus Heimdallarchaeota archaeon]|nr:IS200/IS605 family element transposase accessory protein TnpB [Candidatus Heimdallarchaeota archaeon]